MRTIDESIAELEKWARGGDRDWEVVYRCELERTKIAEGIAVDYRPLDDFGLPVRTYASGETTREALHNLCESLNTTYARS